MRPFHLLILVLLLLLGYLLFWPVPINPVQWQAPPAPILAGPYAVNERLSAVQRFGQREQSYGPEDTATDANGRIYAGWADGKIYRYSADLREAELFTDTGGRPLGLAFAPDGQLYVADGLRHLLVVDSLGNVRQVSTAADGVAFKFVDDLDVAANGKVYFSDASSKFAYGDELQDVLEHGGHGRLLEYDPATQQTTTLMSGLQFANGVALGPNDAFVLINETGSYQIQRYWLSGNKRGQSELFAENLPGFPDNISFNGNDTFWLALYSPRNDQLDAMSTRPWIRKLVFRLAQFLQPKPEPHAFVLGLDLQGRIVTNLQHANAAAYAPITSVEQRGQGLVLGSLSQPSLAWLPLADVQQ